MKVTVGIVTWNVGNEEPFWGTHAPALAGFFPDKDIIVVGVQECKYQAGERKTSDDPDEDDLVEEAERRVEVEHQGEAAVRTADPEHTKKERQVRSQSHFSRLLQAAAKTRGYATVVSESLNQIRFMLFARTKVAHAISHVRVFKEATGILHVYGNKGGLGASIEIQGNRLTFVTAHLAAHLHHIYSRNNDVEEILKGTHIIHKRFDLVSTSDHLFFCGDLNYRVDLDYVAGQKPENIKVGSEKHIQNLGTIMEAVNKKDHTFLLAHDQLALERQRGAVFAGFQEQPIAFAPTFKVKRDRQIPDAEKSDEIMYTSQRMPSYCDRVLWSSLPGLASLVTPTEYTCLPNVSTSDHKPVRAGFDLTLIPPPARHSSHSNLQLLLKSLAFSGGDLATRSGFYLIVTSQPSNLVTLVHTNSEQTPDWSSNPVSVQLHTLADSHVSETFHVIIALVDDRFGPDVTLGIAAISVHQVATADNKKLKFRLPMRRDGVDTLIFMEGVAELVAHGKEGWKEPKSMKYTKSIKQML